MLSESQRPCRRCVVEMRLVLVTGIEPGKVLCLDWERILIWVWKGQNIRMKTGLFWAEYKDHPRTNLGVFWHFVQCLTCKEKWISKLSFLRLEETSTRLSATPATPASPAGVEDAAGNCIPYELNGYPFSRQFILLVLKHWVTKVILL
jgi:hypothetical protein